MKELPTVDKARILVHAATGEDWGDGEIVTDLVVGYAEPGYGTDESVIVFGNWNPKRFPRNDEPTLTKAESLAPRLADALVKVGAEIEWLDEWVSCADCNRAMRISGDSYGWTMYGAFFECEYVCANCMRKDVETFLEPYLNDPSKAVTWIGKEELSTAGFVQWEPDDPHSYENGQHPGQTDDPKAIFVEIGDDDKDVVFLIDGVGQFDVHFSAWTRAK